MNIKNFIFYQNYNYLYKRVRSHKSMSCIADIVAFESALAVIVLKYIFVLLDCHFHQNWKAFFWMIIYLVFFFLDLKYYFSKEKIYLIQGDYLFQKKTGLHILAILLKIIIIFLFLMPWEE